MVEFKFSGFTDFRALKASFKRAKKSVLFKAGAFVRRRAKGSIRRGPQKQRYVPVPNKPPRSWTDRLKDLIFFAVDEARDSVVIGPLLFRSRSTPPATQVLEEGGVETSRGKTSTYRKFPYMEPALQAEAPKFPELFSDSVK